MDRILIASSDNDLKKWNKLLENKNLNKYVKENDISIKFVNDGEISKEDIDKSSLLITDYADIYTQFIKKLKPVIFYQTRNQRLEFSNFGKILADEDDVVNRIIGYANMNYRLENIYQKKSNKYFEDNNIVYN